jgi:peptidoglycan hydrolase CwlO-like protein
METMMVDDNKEADGKPLEGDLVEHNASDDALIGEAEGFDHGDHGDYGEVFGELKTSIDGIDKRLTALENTTDHISDRHVADETETNAAADKNVADRKALADRKAAESNKEAWSTSVNGLNGRIDSLTKRVEEHENRTKTVNIDEYNARMTALEKECAFLRTHIMQGR